MTDQSFSERMKRKLAGKSPTWRFPSNPILLAAGTTPDAKYEVSVSLAGTLSPHERGAVLPVAQSMRFDGKNVDLGTTLPDYEDIRTTLMFFDKFDIPTSTGVTGLELHVDELDSLGLLFRSEVNARGKLEKVMTRVSFEAFKEHDLAEPGQWSLSRSAQAFGVPMDELLPRAGFALTLQNALPVFTREVPLADILEFKERRRSEMLALRSHLDALVIEIGQNGPNSFEQTVVFERFQTALEAHVAIMNESNRAKTIRSLRLSSDWTAFIPPAIDFAVTHAISPTAAVGGLAVIGLKTAAGLRRKPSSVNPFEYLTSAHLDL